MKERILFYFYVAVASLLIPYMLLTSCLRFQLCSYLVPEGSVQWSASDVSIVA